MSALKNKTVLIVGRGSGIAGAIALAVREAGGQVIAAGRSPDELAEAYRGMNFGIERVDVTDESSVADLAGRVASVDHCSWRSTSRRRSRRTGRCYSCRAPRHSSRRLACLRGRRRAFPCGGPAGDGRRVGQP